MTDFRMRRCNSKSAFTLVELLVVIALVLIASSLIFVGGGGGDGAALSSSQRIVSGIAKGARSQAILKGATARLIIHNDPSEPEKYRRLFGIIYADTDPDNNPNTPAPNPPTAWFAGTQGTLLPEGIYFDPDESEDTDLNDRWNDQLTMDLEYPRSVSKSEGGADAQEFFYYEFNSNGTMAPGFSNAALVIRAGTLKPEGNDFVIDYDEDGSEGKKYVASALIFRRVGTSTLVTDPNAIVD